MQPEKRVTHERDIAVRELDLMHQAIQDGDLKLALRHKKTANMAIDEMMLARKMVEEQ